MNIFLRRYWLPLLLVIAGALVALVGVGNATIWKPNPQVSASLPTSSQKQALAITRPGMFELYDSPTKITVAGQGKVALAIGRSADVTAWAADQNYVEVTGQKDDTTLLTEPHQGKADPRQPGEAAGKDMWVEYKEVDTGRISETWDRSEGAWSLIAWSEEGNVQLTLQWTQPVSTPWFWPLLIAGLLLILIGAVVAVVINRLAVAAAKEEAEIRKRREQRTQEAAAQGEQTVQIPALNAVTKPPSRSELRKARERGEATIEVEGVKFPTGLVPVIHTDADGQAINPEASDSLTPEVPATEEVSAPTMPAAELALPAQSPQPAAYSPLPEATPEVSFNPAVSPQPAQSYQPETSYNPAASLQPTDSYQPLSSYSPAASLQPADSYQPHASYNPAASLQPEASYNPAASPQPAQSYQPHASYNPAASYQPPANQAAVTPEHTEEWYEDDDFDLDGLGDGPDMADFEGESTFDQSQGGSNR
ncbi:MAG: hypothetical protein KH307_08165 [Varibaculum cambriense]|uniref:hypothetical protein n=1 Tax=Varibaculum cambriense TaxID=184870 RepID=UPI00241CC13F|nr:hypothetical protein [Varibaculum cambriense]MBS6620258.1 hypothetical protein [Varibaculum cambriense]